jgi:hypothetical protein
MQWRVKPVLPFSKLFGAVGVIVLAVAFAGRDPVRWALGAVLCVALALWALRDFLAPVRLAADASGVTVLTGVFGRRHLPWSAIERVRVERTSRRGLTSELLEVDAGDALYLFSANALGAMPEDVATELAQLRTL